MGHAHDGESRDDDVYTVHYDHDDDEPLSTAVVVAVTEAAGLDAHELPEALYDVVDPDALDDLFRRSGETNGPTTGEVSFTLAGYHVTVDADGSIAVELRDGT